MIYDEPTMKEVCEAFNLKGVHPAANLFPLVTGDEFQALCQSIGKDGLEEPVVLTHDGLLLDGRNRLRALLVTGSTERFKTLDETYASDNYIGYVLRLNLHRRHLSASQKAALAVDVEKLYADLAKERQVRTAENRAKVESLVPPILAEQEATEPPPFELSASVPVAPKLERWQEVEQWKKENPTAAQIQPIKNRDNESAVQAAKATGASAGYVKDAKAIAAKSPEMFEQVKAGTVSIPEAKRVIEIQEQSKPKFRGQFATIETWGAMSPDDQSAFLAQRDDKFKFNKQGDTAADSMGSIEWADWSWNPVTGCLHDCPYCYARDIAERFYQQGFAPSFWPGRLAGPVNTKVPAGADIDIAKKNVFSNSMSDLYGRWVPDAWINAVLQTMRDSPEWNFLMLTKFPNRAAEFQYAANCWIGASVDMQARVKVTEAAFERIECGVKWLSLEPLIEPLTFTKPQLFNWVVIGGASKSTKTPEWVPPAEWVIRTASQFLEHGAKIYLKTNGRPREYPGVITPASADDVFHYLKSAKV